MGNADGAVSRGDAHTTARQVLNTRCRQLAQIIVRIPALANAVHGSHVVGIDAAVRLLLIPRLCGLQFSGKLPVTIYLVPRQRQRRRRAVQRRVLDIVQEGYQIVAVRTVTDGKILRIVGQRVQELYPVRRTDHGVAVKHKEVLHVLVGHRIQDLKHLGIRAVVRDTIPERYITATQHLRRDKPVVLRHR